MGTATPAEDEPATVPQPSSARVRVCPPRTSTLWLSLLLVCGLGVACVTAQDGLRPSLLRGGGASRSAVLEEGGGTRRFMLRACMPSDPSCSPLAVTWREAAVPAALLASAPLLTKLLAMLGVPPRVQWVVCVLLLGSSSAVAAWGLPDAAMPWAQSGSVAPPRLAAEDITGAVARRLDGTANAPAAAALGRWAAQWERGVAGEAAATHAEAAEAEARAAAKLLLFGEQGGPLARAVVRDVVASGAVRADDVLQLSAADAGGAEDDADEGGGTIERFLATRTEARRPSLVVVQGLDGCGSDAAFDRAIAPLERLIEPTLNQPVDTAYGPVRASLHAVLLVAGMPAARAVEACMQLRADASADPSGGGGGVGEARLQQALDAELEAMWPRHVFSSGVNAAKRAFVNRIAGAKVLLCEAEQGATPS